MPGSSNDSLAKLFHKVFIEGPLEELINRCDVVTSASLIGLSNRFLQSAKLSATLPKSRPFGLPCTLHSHPTRRPWEYNEAWPVGSECSPMPLDRISSDALMLNDFSKQRAGSNGVWIAKVGLGGHWNLVNMYSCRKIDLPQFSEVQATDSALTFMYSGYHIELQKIVICQVPTTAGSYADFSLLAIFDFVIGVLLCNHSEWKILKNQFLGHFRYIDAVIHEDRLFAVAENGRVNVWETLSFGPLPLRTPHEFLQGMGVGQDNADDPVRWWLARSALGYGLFLVYTHGVTDENTGIHPGDVAADGIVHYGRTLQTYASGFQCMVFSMDTWRINPNNLWSRLDDLGPCSLFLGLNYPIHSIVGGSNDAPGKLARRNYVYTSHHALSYANWPRPEICRFSLNATEAVVGFSTSTDPAWSKTPLWFIPSLDNAADWH